MNFRKRQIEIILRTIGSIASPNYKRIASRISDREEFFDSAITPVEIEHLHKIAKVVGDKEDAADFILKEVNAIDATKDEKVLEKAASYQEEKDKEKKQKQKKYNGQAGAITQATAFFTRITDNKIFTAKFESQLVFQVNEAIKEGWLPYGGVAFMATGMSVVGGNSFIQAMVKINGEHNGK